MKIKKLYLSDEVILAVADEIAKSFTVPKYEQFLTRQGLFSYNPNDYSYFNKLDFIRDSIGEIDERLFIGLDKANVLSDETKELLSQEGVVFNNSAQASKTKKVSEKQVASMPAQDSKEVSLPSTTASKNNDNHRKSKLDKTIIVALIGVAGTIIAALIAIAPSLIETIGKTENTATATESQISIQQSFPESTPIPRFDKILEINFSSGDRGVCVTDDSKIGGYDTSQDDYFVFGKKYGYITYCNVNEKINQGSLEIKADPSGSPDYFGYGVLIGFTGGEQRNLCSFEIIKDFSKTKIVFGEYINNKFKPTTTLLEGYTLDTNPHTLRMVVYPDGKTIGYIDDIKIAEHTFAGCSEGRLGFVAYGQGDDKIIFDDLKLYAIP